MDQELSVLNELISIGISEQKAKETAKNEKLCKDLLQIITLVTVLFLTFKYPFMKYEAIFNLFTQEL